MRHTYIALALAALAAPSLARPDGVGGHHGDHGAGHHIEHGASAGGSAPSSPAASYGAPSSGYEQPSSGYEQPSVSYEPSSGYEQPSGSYQEPQSAYGEPASGYTGPSGYSEPASGYGPTGSETAAAGGFDLSTLLVPILIIAGLALLFPQVVTVPVAGTAGRKKREAGGESHKHTVHITPKQTHYTSLLLPGPIRPTPLIKTSLFAACNLCRVNSSCAGREAPSLRPEPGKPTPLSCLSGASRPAPEISWPRDTTAGETDRLADRGGSRYDRFNLGRYWRIYDCVVGLCDSCSGPMWRGAMVRLLRHYSLILRLEPLASTEDRGRRIEPPPPYQGESPDLQIIWPSFRPLRRAYLVILGRG